MALGLRRRDDLGFMIFTASFNDVVTYSSYTMLTVDELNMSGEYWRNDTL
jgi:hypothetical protein